MITNTSIKPAVLANDLGAIQRATGFIGAGVMTLGLLFLMTQLIRNDMPVLEEEVVLGPLEINYTEPEEDVKVVEPIIPKINDQPELKRKQIETAVFSVDDLDGINVGKQQITIEIEKASTMGLPAGMAMVPIAPVFPETMAARGICGFALVQFDISKSGVPVNVVSLEASHPAFAKSAIRAVKRARYKPAAQGEASAEIVGKQEKISFVLEDGC